MNLQTLIGHPLCLIDDVCILMFPPEGVSLCRLLKFLLLIRNGNIDKTAQVFNLDLFSVATVDAETGNFSVVLRKKEIYKQVWVTFGSACRPPASRSKCCGIKRDHNSGIHIKRERCHSPTQQVIYH